jgi:hypothetical protein
LEGHVSSLIPRINKLEASLSSLQDGFVKAQEHQINYNLATRESINGLYGSVQALALHQLNVHGVTTTQQSSDSNVPTAPEQGLPVPTVSASSLPVPVPTVPARNSGEAATTQVFTTQQHPASAAPTSATVTATPVSTTYVTPSSTAAMAINCQTLGEAAAVSRIARSVGHPHSSLLL